MSQQILWKKGGSSQSHDQILLDHLGFAEKGRPSRVPGGFPKEPFRPAGNQKISPINLQPHGGPENHIVKFPRLVRGGESI